ncbi:hypothetical protein AJ88_33415 [Mesorhizobium amorphae CCBAU 01583]|nr:hypothetical protein AJ88_33415 [Mesorhizobium amorphae CCBAU 01583]
MNELTVAEAAYLASLPKGPNNYHPFKHADRALERRNWVIDQMVENGYVTREEGDKAKAEPLGVTPRRNGTYLFAGEYFTEEVRRQIISRYGENALYEGGLSVRTTLDPKIQLIARKAMQNGLLKYDTLRGYRGPVKNIDVSGDWGVPLGSVKGLEDVPEWSLAVVLDSSETGLTIGLQPARQVSGASSRSASKARSARKTWALPCAMWSTARRSRPSRRPMCSSPATSSTCRRTKVPTAPTACARFRKWKVAWSPWIRTPAACWPWSVASPMRSRNSTARRRRCASRAPRSSRSSIRRRSTMAIRRPR